MSSVDLASQASARPADLASSQVTLPMPAASSTEAFGKLMTTAQYATSAKGRQQITEAESNLFMSIILAGVAWIAIRALFPARKRPKK